MTTSTAPVVLITGASTGLGRVSAELLAANGFRVFGTSRAPRPDRALPYAMLPLDVRSDESARACVEMVLAQAGRIDVLINNAGYGLSGALEEATLAQAQALFETNFFGAVRMINAVLPAMRERRSGTIVNISSVAGLGGLPFEGFYSASKHALEGYSETLRHEVRGFNIRVALVEPGFFRSDFAQVNQEPERLIADYAAMRQRATAIFDHALTSGPDPRSIAQLILRILRSRAPRLRHLAGSDAQVIALGKRALPASLAETLIRWVFRLDDPAPPRVLTSALQGLLGWGRGRRAPEAKL